MRSELNGKGKIFYLDLEHVTPEYTAGQCSFCTNSISLDLLTQQNWSVRTSYKIPLVRNHEKQIFYH